MRVKRKRGGRKSRRSGPLAWLRSLHWTLWMLLFMILFFAFVRFRLRDVPLERDEGEYAYSGQLMLQGIPPYQFAYNMKLPGTYAAYALIMAMFGQTSAGIHTGLLLVNAATSGLVFLLGRKLHGAIAGAFSGMTYAALSASSAVFGLAGHATHFVAMAAVAGILLLIYALESDRLALFFLSGTCLGLAFLMKQPGIVFSVFAFAYFTYSKWNRCREFRYSVSRGGALLAGIGWPFAMTCLILRWAGVFPKFWFWTFSYARTYAATLPFATGMLVFQDSVTGLLRREGAIWLVALTGLVALFLNHRAKAHPEFVGGLLAFSFLGVSAGLYFRGHYFIMLLPATALLSGIAVASSIQVLQDRGLSNIVVSIPAVVFALAAVISVIQERDFLFALNPLVACERMYYQNPFVEAQKIGEFLEANTPPTVRLAVFGSEPEIYFYSQRHSATGYTYMYGLMEDQKYAEQMQREMI